MLDAGHAFDRQTTRHAAVAADALDIPYLRVERPAWDLQTQPRWRRARDVKAANALIAPKARVFATTGWDSLPDYSGFRGEVLMLRQTRQHTRPPPFAFVEMVFGAPPFSARDEQELFLERRIDTLVCRNLGGSASRPKLDAAKAIDMRVILIDRPPLPASLPIVPHVEDALDWVRAL